MGRNITAQNDWVTPPDLSTELDNRLVDSTHQGRLDATVSSRAPASTALSNATWTDARAGKLDNLDAAVSSRLNLSGLQGELDLRSVDATHLNRLDTSVSSRAPASSALSNTVWTNTRAAKLDNLDAAVSSRLTLSGLQGELNARSVDSTHLNRLDTSVSSRLASSDAALDMLRPPGWIHGNGLFVFFSSSVVGYDNDISLATYSVPANTATLQTIYSRNGRGVLIFAGAFFNTSYNASIAFRLIIDGVIVWDSSHTTSSGSSTKYGMCAPVGVVYQPSSGVYRYVPGGQAVKYNSSVTVQAYDSGPGGFSKVFYKEYRY